MSRILVAHSPDADDIFMFYAIFFGWVGQERGAKTSKIRFSNIALDIETLNLAALEAKYLISAISFGLYPRIFGDYALLNTAMSFGFGYGPKLIKRKNTRLKRRFKVALSGRHTTNALLFSLRYPEAKIIYKNFLEIEESVLSGEADAGVLIHESILKFDENLEVEANLWDIWCDLAGENLPLPLGGMAISRSIPLLRAIECQEILTNAVRVAVGNKKLLSRMLKGRVRVDERDLEVYLNMYANEDSISLSPAQIAGLERLFELGFSAGIYPRALKVADCLLPCEYKALRFS